MVQFLFVNHRPATCCKFILYKDMQNQLIFNTYTYTTGVSFLLNKRGETIKEAGTGYCPS